VKHDIPHPQSKNKTLEVSVIPEGDIIRLAIKCPLDGADKFESWIFDTVIPSVLNNGAYVEGATEEETKKIVEQFKESKYLTKEIHDRSSLRKFIREYDKMKLDECIETIAEITIKVKGKIKHQLLDVAIKELTTIDDSFLRDTIKHTYIKDTIAEGIIRLQDIIIGKLKRRVSRLEQVG
jgi:hypothetical protein